MSEIMTKHFYLLIGIWSSLVVNAQDFGFIQADNSYQKLFKELGVKKANSIYLKYENGEELERYLGFVEIFNKEGFVVSDMDYFSDDYTEYWESTYEYDQFNRVVSCIYYDSDYPNELEGSDITYYEDGRIDSICDYRVENKITILDSCYVLSYNRKGKLISASRTDEVAFETFKYDGNDVLCYDENQKLKSVHRNGNIHRYVWDEYDYRYEFDRNNNLIKSFKIMKNGDIPRVTKFFYLENGLLNESVTFNSENKIISATEYSYEFFAK
jgi:YD repeat-containing protein